MSCSAHLGCRIGLFVRVKVHRFSQISKLHRSTPECKAFMYWSHFSALSRLQLSCLKRFMTIYIQWKWVFDVNPVVRLLISGNILKKLHFTYSDLQQNVGRCKKQFVGFRGSSGENADCIQLNGWASLCSNQSIYNMQNQVAVEKLRFRLRKIHFSNTTVSPIINVVNSFIWKKVKLIKWVILKNKYFRFIFAKNRPLHNRCEVFLQIRDL